MKSVLTMSSFCVGTPPSWNVWCRLTWATWSRLNPGRRVRARCLVALIGVNKIVIILHSPFLCFSGEPVVPGPCARWIRVARQRWAPSMFDSFVRQRFCHRRHLGGRWWDPYYGRQPRYWFTKSQRDSLKKKISVSMSWHCSLRSIRKRRIGPINEAHFLLFIAGSTSTRPSLH